MKFLHSDAHFSVRPQDKGTKANYMGADRADDNILRIRLNNGAAGRHGVAGGAGGRGENDAVPGKLGDTIAITIDGPNVSIIGIVSLFSIVGGAAINISDSSKCLGKYGALEK